MTEQRNRVLVTGVNGQVGSALLPLLAAEGLCPVPAPRDVLDLSRPEVLARTLDALHPDRIVNCAAYTAVDQAESDVATAFAVNAEAPGVLARWCATRQVPLVQISTDYVFPGRAGRPYREDDPTAPLGVYGKSKLAGEDAVRASGCRHIILRTAWVYAATGKNFVRTMLRLGQDRDELRVVADQQGCPTAAFSIAQAICRILACVEASDALWGTYHYVDSGETTWHGFAEAIFDRAERRWGRRPTVQPITTADYPTPAERPAYSVLDTGKFQRAFDMVPPAWTASLDRVMTDLLA